eukprot:CAMPEP_0113933928 /NCGR_PEP_ID=MMETSP1339-20121228/1277_1 /TAXON_ID=94617 /ORGANISM="Fibrocapsa japonica" /LENGTH=200 /DNA_ID=CAMNT_0000935497 /DNA_START=145 /DNA_END=747 /DNA_ORIENTATION=+ /assembly_acc=CAM_ASM_000762
MASAFVPSSMPPTTSVSSTKLNIAVQNEQFEDALGAQPPIGFWDPLNLLKDADQERFDRLRYVEIKHGRISMLAVLGHLVQQNVRLPGYLSRYYDIKFSDVPNGLAAWSKVPAQGFFQIFFFIGFLEMLVWKQQDSGIPGDFGIEWAGDYDEETKLRKRAIELNNGRAAMMGILGLMVHEKLSNQPYIINDLFGKGYTFP